MDKEFYIGWQAEAPKGYRKPIRKTLVVLLVMAGMVAACLALTQKKFSTANFEFGQLTIIKGIYLQAPVPMLQVSSNKDIFGNRSYISIPLLGFGKMGADGIIQSLEREKGTSLNGKEITLKGTLLYNDGKLLAQIDSNDHPLLSVSAAMQNDTLLQKKDLGEMTIRGEIVDPKCFFGVMKPGQGKPHKDCAIRCILGGIPPVLRVVNEEGAANYYLVVGPHGEKLNNAVQSYVGEPVALKAKAIQSGDWIVLYTTNNGIQAISKRELLLPGLQTMDCMASR
ncbi:MAG: hypothetical protein KGO82_04170 [Bacteroidota bacterium]|nr:hypothetical protein [Bacteroidota bacterium]